MPNTLRLSPLDQAPRAQLDPLDWPLTPLTWYPVPSAPCLAPLNWCPAHDDPYLVSLDQHPTPLAQRSTLGACLVPIGSNIMVDPRHMVPLSSRKRLAPLS
jgi:hypothetical protein